ncbi:hypothetical protein GNF51_15860, partial [Clostridium perfringens]|uniref:hypothetical protein n=1 Tax=Clostridium perfringens TaxID=1502 RepID=UPI002AC441E3
MSIWRNLERFIEKEMLGDIMNRYLKKTHKEVKGKSTGHTLDILAREDFSKSNESRIVLKYDIDEYT